MNKLFDDKGEKLLWSIEFWMAIFHTGKDPSIPGTKQTERKKEAVALARLLAGFCNRVVTQSGPGERLVATLKPTHLRVQWQSALPPVYFVFSSHVPTIIIIIREESRFARGDRVIFSFSFSLSFSLCVCVCVCVFLCLTAPSTKTRMPGECGL